MPNPTSFTLSHTTISRALVTDAYIGTAFDPVATDPQDYPPLKTFKALWDTGATGTAITENVVRECSLLPIGMTEVHTASGIDLCNVYLVNIGLPNRVGYSSIRVTEAKIGQGIDMIIGMDIITTGDFAITNVDGKTIFSFRVPSSEIIDFVTQAEST